MMMWLMALACGGGQALDALAPAQAEVRVEAELSKVASGEPIVVEVEAWGAEGWSVQAGIPYADGLEVELLETEGPSVVDERSVQVWRYTLTGPDGSYVVGVTEGQATGPGDQSRTFEPQPIFVDIGVDGPVGGEMDGFADAPPPAKPPYGWMAAAAAAVLALLALIYAARRWFGRKEERLPPPTPAHIVAQGAWAEARSTLTDDHELALRLSMVLREYIESTSSIPATAATTLEISDGLRRSTFAGRLMSDDDRVHIERILDATDRLKFAREGGGDDFFAELDKHFETVINRTRPRVNAEVTDD